MAHPLQRNLLERGFYENAFGGLATQSNRANRANRVIELFEMGGALGGGVFCNVHCAAGRFLWGKTRSTHWQGSCSAIEHDSTGITGANRRVCS